MSPKQKIRTDYHDVFIDRSQRSQQWLKTTLIMGLGFLLGMLYQKITPMPACETLTLNEISKPSVVVSKSVASKKA